MTQKKRSIRACFPSLYAFFEKHPRLAYLFAFLVPALLTFVIYSICGVFPVGESSVLILDLNAQYIYFFEALRDAVYGDGSLLYSFERAMGGEFMGIYTYYLASPLSYIVCLFPADYLPEAVYLIMAIKAGLSGLTFFALLKKAANTPTRPALFLSLFYSYSGYACTYMSDTMWIDAVYLLPLIALGIYSLIREKRVALYTLSLAATMLFNYYIGYMSCIFVLFYFFAVYFSESRATGRKSFFPTLIRIGVASVIAVLIAAVSIFPAYYSLTFGKDTFTSPDFANIIKNEFFRYGKQEEVWTTLVAALGKLFIASYDTLRPEGLPVLYSGILTLILVPLFFFTKGVRLREKISFGLLLCLFSAIAAIKVTDLVMHGFQAPNWMNCRYSFIFSFLLLYMAGRYFAEAKKPPHPLLTGGITFAVAALLVLYYVFAEDKTEVLLPFLLTALFLLLYATLLILIRVLPNVQRLLSAIIAAVIVIEVIVSGVSTYLLMGMDVGIAGRFSYYNYGKRFSDVISYTDDNDDSLFYRAERTQSRKFNDGFLIDLNNLSGSTSTLNRKQIDFLYNLGLTARSNYSQYNFSNAVTDMLLGVKYVYASPEKPLPDEGYTLRYVKTGGEIYRISDGYTLEKDGKNFRLTGNGISRTITKSKDVFVYENDFALSLGYTVSESVLTTTLIQPEIDNDGNYILPEGVSYYSTCEGDGRNAMERLNYFVSLMTDSDAPLFTALNHTTSAKNVRFFTTWRNYEKVSPNGEITITEEFRSNKYTPKDEIPEGESATVTLSFKGQGDRHVYMYIPVRTYNETSFTVNGEKRGSYFGNFTYGIYDLGTFPEGSTNTVTFPVGEKGLYLGKQVSYFFTLDTDALAEAYTTLASSNFTVTEFEHDRITATVTASADAPLLLTTIPYDAGWRVSVDGEEVETLTALDACLAVRLSPGEHTVTFTYFPEIYETALVASGAGILLFTAFALPPFLLRRKKKKEDEILPVF